MRLCDETQTGKSSPIRRHYVLIGIIFLAGGLVMMLSHLQAGLLEMAGLFLIFVLPGVAFLLIGPVVERWERRQHRAAAGPYDLRKSFGCLPFLALVGVVCALFVSTEWGLSLCFMALACASAVLWKLWRARCNVHAASQAGDLAALERLLQQKPRLVNSTAKHLGRTPLHIASWAGYADIARFLVQKGADVNATADGQWTALHWAAMKGHDDVVGILLQEGVRVNAKAEDGSTPLHWAARGGHFEIARNLIRTGADASAKDGRDRSRYTGPCAKATRRSLSFSGSMERRNS